MGSTNIANIFAQASLPTDVYNLALQVMEAFNRGETKGQKPPSGSMNVKMSSRLDAYARHCSMVRILL